MPSSMPAVLVHGVPDTERVWSGVIARLQRSDVVTLSLAARRAGEAARADRRRRPRLGCPAGDAGGVAAPAGVLESMTAPALRKILVAAGVPAADAEETARHVDATMKRCILALYRSAVHVGREWSDDLRRITVPGLVP
jgi:hypothetical protein